MADKIFRIEADPTPFEAAMLRAQQSAAKATANIKEQFEQLNVGFSTLKTAFSAVTAAFAGGEIAAKLNEIAERAEALRRSSEIFDMSTTALQGLQVMANQTGVSSEKLTTMMTTLEQKMRQAGEQGGHAAERFAQLGINVNELRDPTFSVQDAMERLGARTNSSAELLAVLGRRGAQLIPLMRQLAENHNAAAEASQRVAALSEQEIAVLSRYHAQVETVAIEWQNFTGRLLSEAAPALGEMQQQLFNILTAGMKTENIAQVARDVSTEFLKWATAAKDLYADLTHIFVTIGTSLGNVAAVFAAAATGHFARAKEIWAEGTADLAEIDKEHDDQIRANHEALSKAILAMDQSALQPVDVTARYKNITPLPDLGVEKLIKVSERYAELEIKNANEILNAIRRSEEEKAQAVEETSIGEIAAAQKVLDEQLKDGEIGAAQFLVQDRALIQQKLAAELQYLNYKRSLNEAAGEDVEKIDVEIAKAHAAALKAMQVADNQARQASIAQWKQLGSSMESAFVGSLKGMIEGTKTFHDLVRSLFSSLVDGLIGLFVKMGVEWAERMIAQQVLAKVSTTNTVLDYAGAAGAAGVASFAGAPWPVDIGAPAFGAAMFADAASYGAAARGYDIPTNINPLVQAHAREMILPPYLADRIRNLSSAPDAQGGARPAAGGAVHVHLGSSLDAKSFRDYVHQPAMQEALASAIQRAYRRGMR